MAAFRKFESYYEKFGIARLNEHGNDIEWLREQMIAPPERQRSEFEDDESHRVFGDTEVPPPSDSPGHEPSDAREAGGGKNVGTEAQGKGSYDASAAVQRDSSRRHRESENGARRRAQDSTEPKDTSLTPAGAADGNHAASANRDTSDRTLVGNSSARFPAAEHDAEADGAAAGRQNTRGSGNANMTETTATHYGRRRRHPRRKRRHGSPLIPQ